ncbi:MAG: F0F1 ATP synthase subunit A [Bacteroidales bacterium]|nr:F0F1 ATP synthase subunit A [Bacteroidales bacterium]
MERSRFAFKIIFFVVLLLSVNTTAKAIDTDIDVKEIVFEHLEDSYHWHITEWNGKDIAIPLPVIVWSEKNGWNVFLSTPLYKEGSYEGFYIAPEGEFRGKLVEKNAAGEEVRPLDLSITKNVFSMLITSTLLIFIVIGAARWYKRHPMQVPDKFVGMMEMGVMAVHDSVIKENIGPDYKRYVPYLTTAFFFILINNLFGLLPIFPGGANLTGNIAVTFTLAICTFLATNIFGTKKYWKDIFWPDTPIFLKVPIPVMPFVEFFGIFTKPFALMIRLFANMMAGHTIILGLTCLIFITASMGVAVNAGMTVVSVLFCIFMNCIEVLVAFLQAYIFTLLSAVYIGLAREK